MTLCSAFFLVFVDYGGLPANYKRTPKQCMPRLRFSNHLSPRTTLQLTQKIEMSLTKQLRSRVIDPAVLLASLNAPAKHSLAEMRPTSSWQPYPQAQHYPETPQSTLYPETPKSTLDTRSPAIEGHIDMIGTDWNCSRAMEVCPTERAPKERISLRRVVEGAIDGRVLGRL
ncbi:hypothetical protein BC832DRAFT_563095 [Gaertneriomyces semiglobifer]|nr:hypothetical protein BC832DRAFT_563095 [Gaertneriomyces semiglobifer]